MLNDTTKTTLADKWAALGDWSPLAALKRTSTTRWLIDGVIPSGSINWMVAAPSSFKTFLALDMATCVASGRDWHGRETDRAVVLYVAGEGDDNIHVCRAAAELAAGDTGPPCIVQARPRLDEAHGLASLLGMVSVASAYSLDFKEVDKFQQEDCLKYLTPEQARKYNAIEDSDRADAYAVRVSRHLYSPWDEALCRGLEAITSLPDYDEVDGLDVFLVIDTYSQTSADDAKGTVSRYIKTLRDLQEKAAALGRTITVLVIDHTTKSNESYMGSLAKLGDSDTMLEVARHGNNAATLTSLKMRSGPKFAPIHLDLLPFTLEGFNDAQDRPLTSLIVSDGEQAHKIRKAAGADSDTAAALVLALLAEAGECTKDALRQRFDAHTANKGKNAGSIARAFDRAISHLTKKALISQDSGGLITPVSGVDLVG